MAKYKYDKFQIVKYKIQIHFDKYKYKFQNVNLFSNIHPMIMLLTNYIPLIM